MSRRCRLIQLVVVIGLVIIGVQRVFAASTDSIYKPLTFAVNPGDELFVRGFKGDLSFEPNEAVRVLTIEVTQKNPASAPAFARELFDQWQFTLERQGRQIRLVVSSPASKDAWQKLIAEGGVPDFIIKIKGPSLPASIYWREGKVQMDKWVAPVKLSLISGEILLKKGRGDLRINIQKGSLDVREQEGQLTLESYEAKVLLKGIRGSVKLENFAGGSQLNELDGGLTLTVTNGVTKVVEGNGKIDFNTLGSTLRVEDFEGPIKGQSTQGAVFLALKGEANVSVKSEDGEVAVKAPGSGAEVNVGSVEGKLWVPNFLRLLSYPDLKVRQGRLKGSTGGRIYVRTNTGAIRVQ